MGRGSARADHGRSRSRSSSERPSSRRPAGRRSPRCPIKARITIGTARRMSSTAVPRPSTPTRATAISTTSRTSATPRSISSSRGSAGTPTRLCTSWIRTAMSFPDRISSSSKPPPARGTSRRRPSCSGRVWATYGTAVARFDPNNTLPRTFSVEWTVVVAEPGCDGLGLTRSSTQGAEWVLLPTLEFFCTDSDGDGPPTPRRSGGRRPRASGTPTTTGSATARRCIRSSPIR